MIQENVGAIIVRYLPYNISVSVSNERFLPQYKIDTITVEFGEVWDKKKVFEKFLYFNLIISIVGSNAKYSEYINSYLQKSTKCILS